MQNINQSLYSQKTPHILPSWASYGVSIVRILEKIDNGTTLYVPNLLSHMYDYEIP